VLARSLGVTQLIVAVNKMDVVAWSQARFEDIRTQLSLFLKQVWCVRVCDAMSVFVCLCD
jgi:translation elongation factor EF-1alpha